VHIGNASRGINAYNRRELPTPDMAKRFGHDQQLAKALDTHLVYGFQDEAPDSKSRRTPKRELVVSA